MQLSLGSAEATFKCLMAVVKLVDAKSTTLFKSYTDKYYEAFLAERKEGLPAGVLVRCHQ